MGLNLKILLTLSVILVGFAVASGMAFNVIQRRELKDHLHQQGGLMVTMLSGSLQSGLFFEDRTSIDQAVKTLVSLKVHRDLEAVTVYDTHDGILLRQLLSKTEKEKSPDLPSMVAPMATALSSFRHNPEQGKVWENDDLIIFTATVSVLANQQSNEALFFDTEEKVQARTEIGYAQLVIGKAQFHQAVDKTMLRTTVLTIFFLLISLAATYMLTRETMTPLRRLIDTIRARGGATDEVEPDEVGLLDDTFSQLVADLERAFSTIQGLKDGLEETVKERTHELSCALAELQESHMQLAQSEKMVAIGRLVAGVAHEINNTTNFISGALPPLRRRLSEMEGLLHGPAGERPDVERCGAIFKNLSMLLNNVSEGARRTNKIVSDLKNFSRPVDELPGPVDINQCLRTTCSLAYPEYKHRLGLNLELAEGLPLVEGVEGQLNQVFMNLLLNAVQAQPGQGTILIRTWQAADQVYILFHDNGPGIPAGVINKIFEPFFTTKEMGKGTGLGLSISYGIIRKHQGTILVRSEPGDGAEFEITLPLRRQQIVAIITEERQ
jgi:signal transduction histidine kinase